MRSHLAHSVTAREEQSRIQKLKKLSATKMSAMQSTMPEFGALTQLKDSSSQQPGIEMAQLCTWMTHKVTTSFQHLGQLSIALNRLKAILINQNLLSVSHAWMDTI